MRSWRERKGGLGKSELCREDPAGAKCAPSIGKNHLMVNKQCPGKMGTLIGSELPVAGGNHMEVALSLPSSVKGQGCPGPLGSEQALHTQALAARHQGHQRGRPGQGHTGEVFPGGGAAAAGPGASAEPGALDAPALPPGPCHPGVVLPIREVSAGGQRPGPLGRRPADPHCPGPE